VRAGTGFARPAQEPPDRTTGWAKLAAGGWLAGWSTALPLEAGWTTGEPPLWLTEVDPGAVVAGDLPGTLRAATKEKSPTAASPSQAIRFVQRETSRRPSVAGEAGAP
jgi:hypothetical protein